MAKAYYFENNGYNGILLANGDRWISINDIVDGLDINRENLPQIVKNFTEAGFNDSDFDSMWNSRLDTIAYSDEAYKPTTPEEALEEQDTFEEIYKA